MTLIGKHMYAWKISLWIIHLYLNNLGWDSLIFRARKNSLHPHTCTRTSMPCQSWSHLLASLTYPRDWCSDKLWCACTCTLMDLGCHFTSFPPWTVHTNLKEGTYNDTYCCQLHAWLYNLGKTFAMASKASLNIAGQSPSYTIVQ